MIKTKIILGIVAFIVWALFSFPATPERLAIGVLVSVFVAFMTGDLFDKETAALTNAGRYLWFFYYVPLFIWECIKANIDGAWRVCHPDLPINPGIVRVRTTLTSDIALTFLANTLTLKPGTMTVDIDKEKGILYVHWIDVKEKDVENATKLIVEKFERILKRIFP
jgi:multicomponent Na+:H+ antiporter subunit E